LKQRSHLRRGIWSSGVLDSWGSLSQAPVLLEENGGARYRLLETVAVWMESRRGGEAGTLRDPICLVSGLAEQADPALLGLNSRSGCACWTGADN